MSYIRNINETFIDDLNTGKLKRLLEIVKSDKNLQLEIRKNYINIYYLGGCLFKVEQLKRKGYKFSFDKKYCLTEQDRNFVIAINQYDIESWLSAADTLKDIMKGWSKVDKQERKVQQIFCRENASSNSSYFVIDMEYTYKLTKKSSVDMVALTKKGKELKIVLIELKQGYKAVANKSGLSEHYKDYVNLIKNLSNDLTETVKNIYYNKLALGLISDCFDLSTLSGFEILFVLYNYSKENAKVSTQLDTAKNEIEQLKEDIFYDYIEIPEGRYTI